jgi:hypothetical protein
VAGFGIRVFDPSVSITMKFVRLFVCSFVRFIVAVNNMNVILAEILTAKRINVF